PTSTLFPYTTLFRSKVASLFPATFQPVSNLENRRLFSRLSAEPPSLPILPLRARNRPWVRDEGRINPCPKLGQGPRRSVGRLDQPQQRLGRQLLGGAFGRCATLCFPPVLEPCRN